ncbi:MAG: hypothetical protein A2Y06_00030 [Omnitrophica WOR_2 bacterium GWA2_37_7]|nr:MAG: hypothetical protein A2Y06_00030 [Omnitrophica WOR_2 bacterium GWA2_37_7]
MYKKLKQITKSRFPKNLLFFFILILLIVPFYFQARHLTTSNLIEKNSDELSEIVEYIDVSIENRMSMLDQLIRNDVIGGFLKDPSISDGDPIKNLIEKARVDSGSDIVYLMDMSGTVVASTIYDGGRSLTGNNYAFRVYFTDALKGGLVVFPAVGVTTNKRGLYISSRIYSVQEGRVLGVVVFKVGLDDLDQFLSKYDSPKMLVSADGIVFATNDEDSLYRSLNPLSEETLQEIRNSKQLANNEVVPLEMSNGSGETVYKKDRFFIQKGETFIKGWQVVSLKHKILGLQLNGYQFRILALLLLLMIIIAYFSIYVHSFETKEFSLNRIRSKVVVPVGSALLLISLTSMWSFYAYHKNKISLEFKKVVKEVNKDYYSSLNSEASIIASYIDLIEQNKNLQQAYITNDRKALYEFSKPIFQELNRSYQITHFYFHDTQRNNYLRVHKPDDFGDFIDRYTMGEAYRKGVTKYGIELGPYGRLALRVVRPWIVDGNIIGYIEIGKEIEHVMPNIAAMKNVQIMSFIEKDMLDKAQFLHGQEAFNDNSIWERFSNVVLTGSTVNSTHELDSFFNNLLSKDVNKYLLKVYSVNIGVNKYSAALLPLKDVSERVVGTIVVLKNFDDENAVFMRLATQIVEIEIIAVILLGVFLWLFLGRIERSVLRTTEKLEANITDLKMVSTILMDKEESLEREILYRTNIQKDLVSAKEHAELLSRVVPSAIFTVDIEKKITSWNDYIERLTGYSKDEVMGKECSFFAVSPCVENCALFSNDLQKPLISRKCTINCKDGRLLKVFKNVDYLKNNDGDIIGGIECFEDVTDRAEQEKRIAEAYKEIENSLAISESLREDLEEAQIKTVQAAQVKSDFLANMSHEMRTPMNAILGFSDLLKMMDLTEMQRAYVETISSSGELLIKIINDILDFSKLDSGMAKLENVNFSLEYLLNDVFKIAVFRTKKSSVEIYIDIDPDVNFNLKGDPTRLRQVFLNLLSNAIKFTRKGSIGVIVKKQKTSAKTGQTLRFIVKDTGVGIAQDKKEIIFDSFVQGDTSTTRKYGGTGLGLTICRSIVTTMGGEIWVESKEGKGSEFIFVLDFEDGDSIADEDVVPVKNMDLNKQKVIIVDDNEIARKIHVKCCESLGLEILSVEDSPNNALEKIKELEVDGIFPNLILCDLVMEDMDGFAFASEVRSNKNLKDVKMIAITAEPEIGGAGYAQTKGFNGYLPKPVTLEELKNVIRTVFGDKRRDKTIVTRHMAKELNCKGARVLVVEDSVTNQMLMREYFRQLGCMGEFTISGYEAIDILRINQNFDMVLMDIQLAGLSGIEATKMIRKDISEEIPIIALTAAVFDEDKQKAKQAGMNDFLPKPVSLAALKEMISKYRET